MGSVSGNNTTPLSPVLLQNEISISEFDAFRSSTPSPSSPPVNASRRPSRDDAHHSGPVPAGLAPWENCSSYPLPVFLAHSALGHRQWWCPAADIGARAMW